MYCVDTFEEVTEILITKSDIYSKVTDGLVEDLSELTDEILNEPISETSFDLEEFLNFLQTTICGTFGLNILI